MKNVKTGKFFMQGGGALNLALFKIKDDGTADVMAILSLVRGIRKRNISISEARAIWVDLYNKGWEHIKPDLEEQGRIFSQIDHNTRTC